MEREDARVFDHFIPLSPIKDLADDLSPPAPGDEPFKDQPIDPQILTEMDEGGKVLKVSLHNGEHQDDLKSSFFPELRDRLYHLLKYPSLPNGVIGLRLCPVQGDFHLAQLRNSGELLEDRRVETETICDQPEIIHPLALAQIF